MSLRHILIPILFSLSLTGVAQDTVPEVLVLPPGYDHYYCQLRSGMMVREVLEESRRRFPIGSALDREALGPCAKECNGPISMDPTLRTNGYTEYCLFSGTNGIIGQMVVLMVDAEQRVADLHIMNWGR